MQLLRSSCNVVSVQITLPTYYVELTLLFPKLGVCAVSPRGDVRHSSRPTCCCDVALMHLSLNHYHLGAAFRVVSVR